MFEAGTAFRPTAAMRRYAEACASGEADEAARCRAAGIQETLLRRWRRDARFVEWLRDEVHRRIAGEVWEIWIALHRLARSGNVQAAKMVLERFDPEAARPADTPAAFWELARLAQEARLQGSPDRGMPSPVDEATVAAESVGASA